LRTAANFNGFRVLASLLHRRRSTEVNQSLHDVWPSPGLVTIYTFLPGAKFTLRPSLEVLLYPILAALVHGTRAVGASQKLQRGIFTRQGGHPVSRWVVKLSNFLYFATTYGSMSLSSLLLLREGLRHF